MRRFLTIVTVLMLSLIFGVAAFAPPLDRNKLVKEVEALYAQLQEKEKLLMLPAAEDQARHAEFLSQPDTGIFRLMPRERFEGRIFIRGGGSYYSFARQTNEYGQGSDISLYQGKFDVGFAGYEHGLIAILGDIPLDSVTLTHPATKFLTDYVPASKEAAIRQQQQQTHSGYKAGDFTYTRYAVASPNTTYLLRSIGYTGIDILVAFRVIRRDIDGSVVLLWKKLKVFPAPVAER